MELRKVRQLGQALGPKKGPGRSRTLLIGLVGGINLI